jgi:hypothetical protein
MSTSKGSKRPLAAAGVTSVLAAFQPTAATANGQPRSQPSPNWSYSKAATKTNDVGCAKTTYDMPPSPGGSKIQGDVFVRPPDLDVERLSNSELESCGLPTRPGLDILSKDTPSYRQWLELARAALRAKQLLPWSPSALPPGTPPPPELPRVGPPPRADDMNDRRQPLTGCGKTPCPTR